MKKVFYEKVGRRYKPVYEYDQTLMDSFPEGSHLVLCFPGGKSTRYRVDPAYAPMIAAGRVSEDAIRSAIVKASELRPTRQPLTEGQRKAWNKLKKEFGDEFFGLRGASIHDCVEAGVKAMMEEANKLMSNPGVKKAYEQFLLIAELSK